MKTFVVNNAENTRIPFLRGILTRSLLDAGLSFDRAFDLSTQLRNNLSLTAEISVEGLRERVSEKLGADGMQLAVEQYNAPPGLSHKIQQSWATEDAAICHGMVTYIRHDESELQVPFANILKTDGVLIEDYRIYIDTSQLYQ